MIQGILTKFLLIVFAFIAMLKNEQISKPKVELNVIKSDSRTFILELGNTVTFG